jgi:hypothetical protein
LVYDMDDECDIWVKDPRDSLDELRAANSELVAVLESSISNQSKVTELFIDNKKRLVDGIRPSSSSMHDRDQDGVVSYGEFALPIHPLECPPSCSPIGHAFS